MGVETALLAATVGAGAFTAISQAKSGRQQASSIKRQGEYNAQVLEQQGQMVLAQKKIKEEQYLRRRKAMEGSIIAGAAGRGFRFSGSPLAILVDNETQLGFDKAIADYNSDINYNYTQTASKFTRYQAGQDARLAKSRGYSNAFSTILNTGFLASRI